MARRRAALARDASRIGSFSAQRRRRRGDTNRRDRRVADVRRGVISRARRFVSVASDRRVRRRRRRDVAQRRVVGDSRRVFSRRGDRRRRVRVSRGGARTRLVRGAPAGRHRVGDERRGCRGCRGCRGTGRGRRGRFRSPETWRTSSRMDGASSAKSRSRRRSSARLDLNATRRRTVALACSFPVTRVVASPDGSWLVGFGAEGRARAWRVGDEPAWTGVSQGTRAETPRNDDSDDSTPNPAFSRATRRGVAIPTPTFSEERIAPRGDAPDAACFSPEGDALVGVFDGGMRATWHVPVGPRGHTWTLRKVTFDADRDVLALAVVDGGGVGKNPIHARRVRRSRRR